MLDKAKSFKERKKVMTRFSRRTRIKVPPTHNSTRRYFIILAKKPDPKPFHHI